MSDGGPEKRKFQRIDTQVKVILTLPGQIQGSKFINRTVSRNMSRNGVLVSSAVPLDLGSFVLARFEIPGEPNPVEIFAKVVRVAALAGNRYDIGLFFTGFTPEAIDTVRRYLIDEGTKT
jgi:hypothetical protein